MGRFSWTTFVLLIECRQQDVLGHIERLINTIGSPQISIDERR
jgi:hypothetical protein